jgi:hypothetical protein
MKNQKEVSYKNETTKGGNLYFSLLEFVLPEASKLPYIHESCHMRF